MEYKEYKHNALTGILSRDDFDTEEDFREAQRRRDEAEQKGRGQ